MKYAKPLIGSAILVGLMLAASAWAWPRLGDQPIAVHFDIAGHPNGFAPRTQALLILPALAAGISLFLAILPPIMPRRARLERSWGPYVIVWLAMLTLFLLIHLALIARALGQPVDMGRLCLIGVGALLAVMGNFLGKVRYNYVFGVRTPWTLANEQVWDRTHRFAGRITMIAGLVALITGVSAPAGFEIRLPLVLTVCAIVPGVASVLYSYLVSRKVERGAT